MSIHHNDMVNKTELPVPQIDLVRNRVVNRIKGILGRVPGREELKRIVSLMGWGSLSRNQKRVKKCLLDHLESLAPMILHQLESREGMDELRAAYRRVKSGSTHEDCPTQPEVLEVPIMTLPPEATISFYLNRPTR
jgi:hypothetical protein